MKTTMFRLFVMAGLLALAGGLAACGDDTKKSSPSEGEGEGQEGEGEGQEGEGEGAEGEGAEGEGAEGEGKEGEGAEGEGAEGEGAEGEGAEGEGAEDPFTCGEIAQCAMACPRDENLMGCVGECMGRGDEAAQALFTPLMACVSDNCMEAPDAMACVGQQCLAPYQACMGIVADLDCPQLLECMMECPEGDAACQQACMARGTPEALAAFQPLAACVQENCTDWSEDFESMEECVGWLCDVELEGCETPPGPCELEDPLAPNHDFATAAAIEPTSTLDGYLCPDKPDYFKVALEAGAALKVMIAFDGEEGDLDLFVYGPDEAQLGASRGTGDEEMVVLEAAAAGDYYIMIEGWGGAAGAYTLTTMPLCKTDDDCANEGEICTLLERECLVPEVLACGNDQGMEPNQSLGTASMLIAGQLENLTLCGQDYDLYKLNLANIASVKVLLTTAEGSAPIMARMLSAEQDLLAVADEGEILAKHIAADDYYLLVTFDPNEDLAEDAVATYGINLEITEGPCAANLDCEPNSLAKFCQPAGLCATIEGEGTVPLGGACDSDDDCATPEEGEYEVMCFINGTNGDSMMCTHIDVCEEDEDCAPLRAGSTCGAITDWFGTEYSVCVPPCQSNLDCSEPYQCNLETSQCEPPPRCGTDADCDERWGGVCNVLQGYCLPVPASVCLMEGEVQHNTTSTAKLLVADANPEELICAGSFELFKLTLDAVSTVTISLGWDDVSEDPENPTDLDMYLKDVHGNYLAYAETWDENPELFSAKALPIGEYYLVVNQYAKDLPPQPYVLTVSIVAEGCETSADCAEDEFRKLCLEGACTLIDGQGQVPLGGRCDSSDDCVEEAYGCNTSAATIDGFFCTAACRVNEECADLVEGQATYCRKSLGYCVAECTTDEDCDPDPENPTGEICKENHHCGAAPVCTGNDQCGRGEVCDLAMGCTEPLESDPACDAEDEGNTTFDAIVAADGVELTGTSCLGDLDWFVYEVAADAQTVTVELNYDATELEPNGDYVMLFPFDAAGNQLGYAMKEDPDAPATLVLNRMPAGPVYILAYYYPFFYPFADTPPAEYTFKVTAAAGEPCTPEACAAEVPLYRMTCAEGGGCTSFAGNGAVALGGLCDSVTDCVEDADYCYVDEGGADGWNICTLGCMSDEDCGYVEGTECVPIDEDGNAFCLPMAE